MITFGLVRVKELNEREGERGEIEREGDIKIEVEIERGGYKDRGGDRERGI